MDTCERVPLRKPTALPKVQIWVILLLHVVEPIASQSIYPYINQLIGELDITGGDERRVGYYAGLIESLFFLTECITVLQWSRLSDYIGRKPVLIIGLLGTTMSILLFGLSRTFWALVVSRCLTGLLNGNIGVMKSAIGDLTDASNRADGMGLIPAIWSCGAALGPVIGGTFARPQDRFPYSPLFRSPFWNVYPYFLPCLIASIFAVLGVLMTVLVYKESAPRRKRPYPSRRSASYSSVETLVPKDECTPASLQTLITSRPVLISILNYVADSFLNIAFVALFPLFLAMPSSIGGLEMHPSTIGYIMGSYGAACGLFQFCYFSKIVRWLGPRRVYINGMVSHMAVFAALPVISLCSRGGLEVAKWSGIVVVIVNMVSIDMSFGAIFMYLTASSPNKASLGATNGLAQTLVSMARAIGPAFATSLFSFSVEHSVLGGYGVYAFFVLISIVAFIMAVGLPEEVWEEEE